MTEPPTREQVDAAMKAIGRAIIRGQWVGPPQDVVTVAADTWCPDCKTGERQGHFDDCVFLAAHRASATLRAYIEQTHRPVDGAEVEAALESMYETVATRHRRNHVGEIDDCATCHNRLGYWRTFRAALAARSEQIERDGTAIRELHAEVTRLIDRAETAERERDEARAQVAMLRGVLEDGCLVLDPNQETQWLKHASAALAATAEIERAARAEADA